MSGLPSASRISFARSVDAARSGRAPRTPAVSMEIGKARGPHDAAVGQVDEVAVGLVARPAGGPGGRSWRRRRRAGSRPGRRRAAPRGSGAATAAAGTARRAGTGCAGRSRSAGRAAARAASAAPAAAGSPAPRPWRPSRRPRPPSSAKRWLTVDVGVPPLAVELRLGDEVVVERPQGAVGEALVELLDLLGASGRPAPASRPSSSNGSRSASSPPGQPIQAPSLCAHAPARGR